MTHVRRIGGLILLWALLPFPFLYIARVPFWLIAASVALFVTLRPGSRIRLTSASLNLLGVGIIIAVLAAGGMRVGPLRPLGHLLLLLTSVQVLRVESLRSLVRALPAVFLVWLVAVANSTHVASLVYLAISTVMWWWVGAHLHLLAVADTTGRESTRGLRASHMVIAAGLSMVLAVPVFLIMPRLRSPWIAGRGQSTVTGFSSQVELNRHGVIEESHEPVLQLRSRGRRQLEPDWTRLRGSTLDMVLPGSWTDRRRALDEIEKSQGRILLRGDGRSLARAVAIDIELLRPGRYLFLPEKAVAIDVDVPVRVDDHGVVRLADRIERPLSYTVWVVEDPPPRLAPPSQRDLRLALRDPSVAAVAREVAGTGSPAERSRRLELWLQTSFAYSTSAAPGMQADPVSWFLFRSKEGHCEDFASTMVVCLRSLGIPSRMVVGYSGGTLLADGSEALIRESNAHAWVEAWIGPRRGWVEFDPTPASAVPGLSGFKGMDRLRWTWQRVEAGFDRWVLTFGRGEQSVILDLVVGFADTVGWRRPVVVVLLMAMVLVARAAARRHRRWLHDRRRRPPAARAVARLVGRLRRSGVSVPARATPRWIGDTASSVWPPATEPLGRLVTLAELELYAPGPTSAESAEVRRLWQAVRRSLVACPPRAQNL